MSKAPSSPAPNGTVTPTWKASPGGTSVYINSVAVSGDGGTVLAGTFFNTYGAHRDRRGKDGPPKVGASLQTFGAYCYNKAGALVWKNEFQSTQGVYWVALSSNGRRAAAGGLATESPKAGFIRAYDAISGNGLLVYATGHRVNQLAFSADGQWLVSAAETVLLFKYNPSTGLFGKVSEYASASGDDIVSVAVSADGSTIAFADYSGYVGVLSNASGTLSLRKSWKTPTSFCHMLDMSPNGQYFAGGGADGTFYQFVVDRFDETGTPTYRYSTGLSDPVYGVACSAEGNLFAGVMNDGPDAGRVYAVGIVDFAPTPVFQAATLRNPNSVALNSPRHLMAIADGHPDGTPGHFYLYEGVLQSPLPIVTPTLLWTFETGNMSWPVTLSADGSAVVGGSDDSYVYYFAT